MHMTHSPAAMTDWLIKPLYALLSNQYNEISPSRRVDGPVVFGERPVLDGRHVVLWHEKGLELEPSMCDEEGDGEEARSFPAVSGARGRTDPRLEHNVVHDDHVSSSTMLALPSQTGLCEAFHHFY